MPTAAEAMGFPKGYPDMMPSEPQAAQDPSQPTSLFAGISNVTKSGLNSAAQAITGAPSALQGMIRTAADAINASNQYSETHDDPNRVADYAQFGYLPPEIYSRQAEAGSGAVINTGLSAVNRLRNTPTDLERAWTGNNDIALPHQFESKYADQAVAKDPAFALATSYAPFMAAPEVLSAVGAPAAAAPLVEGGLGFLQDPGNVPNRGAVTVQNTALPAVTLGSKAFLGDVAARVDATKATVLPEIVDTIQKGEHSNSLAQHLYGQDIELPAPQSSVATLQARIQKTAGAPPPLPDIPDRPAKVLNAVYQKQPGFSLSPGYVIGKLSEGIRPNSLLKGLVDNTKEGIERALLIANGWRQSSMILGDEARNRLADAEITHNQIDDLTRTPIEAWIQKTGYDGSKIDAGAENSVIQLFTNYTPDEIYNGDVDIQTEGVPEHWVPFVKALAFMTSNQYGFPKLLGFVGKQYYIPGEGFVNKATNKPIFDVSTPYSDQSMTPEQLRNSSVMYHEENPEGKRNIKSSIVIKSLKHQYKMAVTSAYAPLLKEAVVDPATGEETLKAVVNKQGQYQLDPNGHYKFFHDIASDKNSTALQRGAAEDIAQNIAGRNLKSGMQRTMQAMSSNLLDSMLMNRWSSVIKHYKANLDMGSPGWMAEGKALYAVFTDAKAQQILKKYQIKGWNEIEKLKAGIINYSGKEGFDSYRLGMKSAAMQAFYSKLMKVTQDGTTLAWDDILEGKTPEAREALKKAYLEIQRTQGSFSRMDSRMWRKTGLQFGLIFKGPGLNRIEQLAYFTTQGKEGWSAIGKFALINGMLNGYGALLDKESALYLLQHNPPEWIKPMLIDSATVAGVTKYAQHTYENLGHIDNKANHRTPWWNPAGNISIDSSSRTPLFDVNEIPLGGDIVNFGEKAGIGMTKWSDTSANAPWQPKAELGLETAAPLLGLVVKPFTGPFGIKMSAYQMAKITEAVIRATEGQEIYHGKVIPISPAGEIERLTLAGNINQQHVQNFQTASTLLNQEYRKLADMVEKDRAQQGQFVRNPDGSAKAVKEYTPTVGIRAQAALVTKKTNAYVKAFSDLLEQERFAPVGQAQAVAKKKLSSVFDKGGNEKPTSEEWKQVDTLTAETANAKVRKDTTTTAYYQPKMEEAVKNLQARYPHLTREQILVHYFNKK